VLILAKQSPATPIVPI